MSIKVFPNKYICSPKSIISYNLLRHRNPNTSGKINRWQIHAAAATISHFWKMWTGGSWRSRGSAVTAESRASTRAGKTWSWSSSLARMAPWPTMASRWLFKRNAHHEKWDARDANLHIGAPGGTAGRTLDPLRAGIPRIPCALTSSSVEPLRRFRSI